MGAGNPNWKKGGPSPNPGGRPKAPVRLRELYDENDLDDEIFKRLCFWMRSEDSKASIAAMDRLHDWRYGKTATVNDDGETVSDNAISIIVPPLPDNPKKADR